MEKQLQPKLRFPDFSGDWIKVNLGEIMNFKNGVNASKENYGFGFKFINVLDIINNNIITSDKIIGEVNISEKDFEKNIVEYGDILFQRSSETREEVGQSNVYLDKDKPATFGGFVIRGKKIKEFDPLYLHFLLKTQRARKEITTKSGGSTRYNVGQDTLSNVEIIKSPSLPEQQKIADYLTTIDKKIELLEEKKTELSRYKKAMMQKLFAQEIRFKDENGNDYPEWEEKRLGEVLDYIQPTKFIVKSTEYSDKYSIPVLTAGKSFILGYTNETENIFINNPVIIFDDFTTAFKYVDFPFKVKSSAMKILKLKDEINNIKFIFSAMEQIDFPISDHKRYWISEYQNIKVPIPSVEEQQKIANFLSAIDESITKVEEQIKETQNFKKAMLQQLFV